MLVSAHFLPDAECLATQARLRTISGYAAMDGDVRKCMQRIVSFFPPYLHHGHRRAQAIFDKYTKPAYGEVARLPLRVQFNV